MVDVALIKDTINELLSANVDKDTIYSTLKDIGVDYGDIEKYYSEIVNKTEKHTTAPTIKEDEKKIKKIEVPKPTTTTEELERATKDIEPKIEEIISVKKEYQEPKSNYDEITKKQWIELDEKITDIKAQINGLTKIMKDILEENRNILNKIK